MDCIADMEVVKDRNNMSHKRAKRSSSLVPLKVNSLIGQMAEAGAQKKNAQDDIPASKWRLAKLAFRSPLRTLNGGKATELNMDHIYVKFSDFLWAYTFIGPFSYILWKKGVLVLQIRRRLQKCGLIDTQSKCDYGALAAALCLEQTQVIHFYAKSKESSILGNAAGKCFVLFSLFLHKLSHPAQSFEKHLFQDFFSPTLDTSTIIVNFKWPIYFQLS